MQHPAEALPAVLLVDGDRDSLTMYSTIVTFHGMDPVRCADPEQAVSVAAQCDPAAVVFGLGARAAEGVRVLRELRADPRTSHLPLLVTTTSLYGARLAGLDGVNPDGVLLKPCTPTELVALLSELLHGAAC
jgi:DNA-binding response OmpR family regulator